MEIEIIDTKEGIPVILDGNHFRGATKFEVEMNKKIARMKEAFWAWESVQLAANSSGDGEDHIDANELWKRLKEEMKA